MVSLCLCVHVSVIEEETRNQCDCVTKKRRRRRRFSGAIYNWIKTRIGLPTTPTHNPHKMCRHPISHVIQSTRPPTSFVAKGYSQRGRAGEKLAKQHHQHSDRETYVLPASSFLMAVCLPEPANKWPPRSQHRSESLPQHPGELEREGETWKEREDLAQQDLRGIKVSSQEDFIKETLPSSQ